jgi:hypothetical protein
MVWPQIQHQLLRQRWHVMWLQPSFFSVRAPHCGQFFTPVPEAAHNRNADSLELGHYLFGCAIKKHLLQISKLQEVQDQFPFLSLAFLS